MTVEEIFGKISTHMLNGVMVHEQLANYYDFLGLCGYKKCHEYHFYSESISYRNICNFYISTFNKLISEQIPDTSSVIPQSWYRYGRFDVDINTKKNAIQTGLNKWVNWERDTKKFYESMYKELINIGEINAAIMVSKLVEDVSSELKCAEQYLLNKEMIGYNMSDIIAEQDCERDMYSKKICKLFRKK